jgi:ankyrin repeat protein
MSNPVSRKAAVILVHGTKASSLDDEGDQFWQRSSPFWTAFNTLLGNEGECSPAGGALFHWSGDNSEAARRRAGARLLKRLEDYEGEKGQPYHLIGHSHGGSVVWHALVEAAARGRELTNLRSWATVGTPFLHFRARNCLFALPGLIVAALVCAFVLWRLFAPASTNHRLHVVLASVALGLLGYYAYHFLVRLVGQLRAIRDDKHEATAYALYGQRWLGLGSVHDEAINGLQHAVNLETPITPRAQRTRSPVEGGLFDWVGYPFLKLLSWTVRPVYNVVVVPEGDRLIAATVADALQGNDLRGMYLANVTRGPRAGCDAQRLAPEVENALAAQANANAGRMITRLRPVFGAAAIAGADTTLLLRTMGREVHLDELIHTLYFRDPTVTAQLADHITRWNRAAAPSRDPAVPAPPPPTGDAGRTTWRFTCLQLIYPLIPLILIPMLPNRPWYAEYRDDEIQSLNARDGDKLHPILIAVRQDDPDALDYFLKRSHSHTRLRSPDTGNTILAETIRLDRPRILEGFFSGRFLGDDPCVIGEEALPILHTAAMYSSWEVLSRLLESHKYAVNFTDKAKRTVLHVAAGQGYEKEPLQRLLAAGATVGVQDQEGNTPIHIAAEAGHWETVEFLLNHVNREDQRELVNQRDYFHGRTSLHLAAQKGHTLLFEVLIMCGANPEITDRGGKKPIELAPDTDTAKVLEALQKRNPNP